MRESDRGQAYTLEALVAAILLLTAVLLSLQAVVLHPQSGGTLSPADQTQIDHRATDVLVGAESDGELSRMVRYWDCSSDQGFANGPDNEQIYAPSTGYRDANTTQPVLPVEDLNSTLDAAFENEVYNLQVVYDNSSRRNESRLLYVGSPSANPEVVVASKTVVLTDDMPVASHVNDSNPAGRNEEVLTLSECSNPPIPDEHSGDLYNVVEVRLFIW